MSRDVREQSIKPHETVRTIKTAAVRAAEAMQGESGSESSDEEDTTSEEDILVQSIDEMDTTDEEDSIDELDPELIASSDTNSEENPDIESEKDMKNRFKLKTPEILIGILCCPFCSRNFLNEDGLKYHHLKTHGESQFVALCAMLSKLHSDGQSIASTTTCEPENGAGTEKNGDSDTENDECPVTEMGDDHQGDVSSVSPSRNAHLIDIESDSDVSLPSLASVQEPLDTMSEPAIAKVIQALAVDIPSPTDELKTEIKEEVEGEASGVSVVNDSVVRDNAQSNHDELRPSHFSIPSSGIDDCSTRPSAQQNDLEYPVCDTPSVYDEEQSTTARRRLQLGLTLFGSQSSTLQKKRIDASQVPQKIQQNRTGAHRIQQKTTVTSSPVSKDQRKRIGVSQAQQKRLGAAIHINQKPTEASSPGQQKVSLPPKRNESVQFLQNQTSSHTQQQRAGSHGGATQHRLNPSAFVCLFCTERFSSVDGLQSHFWSADVHNDIRSKLSFREAQQKYIERIEKVIYDLHSEERGRRARSPNVPTEKPAAVGSNVSAVFNITPPTALSVREDIPAESPLHSSSELLHCVHCDYRHTNQDSLIMHFNEIHADQDYLTFLNHLLSQAEDNEELAGIYKRAYEASISKREGKKGFAFELVMCGYCGYKHHDKIALMQHADEVHGRTLYLIEAVHKSPRQKEMNPAGEKPIKCPFCQLRALDRVTIKLHCLVAHKDRSYADVLRYLHQDVDDAEGTDSPATIFPSISTSSETPLRSPAVVELRQPPVYSSLGSTTTPVKTTISKSTPATSATQLASGVSTINAYSQGAPKPAHPPNAQHRMPPPPYPATSSRYPQPFQSLPLAPVISGPLFRIPASGVAMRQEQRLHSPHVSQMHGLYPLQHTLTAVSQTNVSYPRNVPGEPTATVSSSNTIPTTTTGSSNSQLVLGSDVSLGSWDSRIYQPSMPGQMSHPNPVPQPHFSSQIRPTGVVHPQKTPTGTPASDLTLRPPRPSVPVHSVRHQISTSAVHLQPGHVPAVPLHLSAAVGTRQSECGNVAPPSTSLPSTQSTAPVTATVNHRAVSAGATDLVRVARHTFTTFACAYCSMISYSFDRIRAHNNLCTKNRNNSPCMFKVKFSNKDSGAVSSFTRLYGVEYLPWGTRSGYACPRCTFTSRSVEHVRIHFQDKHIDLLKVPESQLELITQTGYLCAKCGVFFRTLAGMMYHYSSVHPTLRCEGFRLEKITGDSVFVFHDGAWSGKEKPSESTIQPATASHSVVASNIEPTAQHTLSVPENFLLRKMLFSDRSDAPLPAASRAQHDNPKAISMNSSSINVAKSSVHESAANTRSSSGNIVTASGAVSCTTTLSIATSSASVSTISTTDPTIQKFVQDDEMDKRFKEQELLMKKKFEDQERLLRLKMDHLAKQQEILRILSEEKETDPVAQVPKLHSDRTRPVPVVDNIDSPPDMNCADEDSGDEMVIISSSHPPVHRPLDNHLATKRTFEDEISRERKKRKTKTKRHDNERKKKKKKKKEKRRTAADEETLESFMLNMDSSDQKRLSAILEQQKELMKKRLVLEKSAELDGLVHAAGSANDPSNRPVSYRINSGPRMPTSGREIINEMREFVTEYEKTVGYPTESWPF